MKIFRLARCEWVLSLLRAARSDYASEFYGEK